MNREMATNSNTYNEAQRRQRPQQHSGEAKQGERHPTEEHDQERGAPASQEGGESTDAPQRPHYSPPVEVGVVETTSPLKGLDSGDFSSTKPLKKGGKRRAPGGGKRRARRTPGRAPDRPPKPHEHGGGDERREPSGYLVGRARAWAPQYKFVRGLIDDALRDAATPGRHRFFLHVLLSQLLDPWEWVPIDHRLIEPLDDYAAEGRKWPCSEEVWRALFDSGLLLYRDHDRERGLSRDFRVRDDIVDGYLEIAPRTVAESVQVKAVDLFSGKVTKRVAKTVLNDGSKNPVGGTLYRRAMKELRRGVFNEPRVLEHLSGLEGGLRKAEGAWKAAGGHRLVGGLRQRMAAHVRASGHEGDRRGRALIEDWRREHGEPHAREYLAYRTALCRYANDLRCWQDGILAQRPQEADDAGIYRYRLAYRHQTSGRAGQVQGGQQSCSREMKAASFDGTGVTNYDLRGSQPNGLVEEFEAANKIGGRELTKRPLNASWMSAYVDDERGKYVWAEHIGVEVDTWKAVLCMLMMGAHLPKDPHESKGDLVKALRADPACQATEDFSAVYVRLDEGVKPFYQELRRWHRWLDTVYVKKCGQNTPAGRVVKNAAGETYVWDPSRPKHERRAELAAHMLQGRERAFVLHLIALAPKYGFDPVSDEHDGLVTLGVVPSAAIDEAKRRAKVVRAALVEKPFV